MLLVEAFCPCLSNEKALHLCSPASPSSSKKRDERGPPSCSTAHRRQNGPSPRKRVLSRTKNGRCSGEASCSDGSPRPSGAPQTTKPNLHSPGSKPLQRSIHGTTSHRRHKPQLVSSNAKGLCQRVSRSWSQNSLSASSVLMLPAPPSPALP